MPFLLRIFDGENQTVRVQEIATRSVKVGRSRKCDVVLESPYISREHAVIRAWHRALAAAVESMPTAEQIAGCETPEARDLLRAAGDLIGKAPTLTQYRAPLHQHMGEIGCDHIGTPITIEADPVVFPETVKPGERFEVSVTLRWSIPAEARKKPAIWGPLPAAWRKCMRTLRSTSFASGMRNSTIVARAMGRPVEASTTLPAMPPPRSRRTSWFFDEMCTSRNA